MGRKPPSSRKRNPRQELAGDVIAAHLTVAGTFETEGPAPPSFILEEHTPLKEAVTSIKGGWSKIRGHLYAGRIQGFIWSEHGRLEPVPAEDWGSAENDNAGQTGRATRLRPARLGGCDLEGFALVKTSGLTTIKPTALQSSNKAKTNCRKWLVSLMCDGQQKTKSKPDYRAEAIERFKVSIRSFDRAWDNATTKTGSDWSKSGRRKRES